MSAKGQTQLDAPCALLPVLWLVLIFHGIMCKLRLREQALHHCVRRDDSPGNDRYALQQRAATNTIFGRVGFLLAAAFSLKISATFSRRWMALFAATACMSTIGFRMLASLALRQLASLPLFVRRVAVAGVSPQINNLLEFMQRTNPPFISVCGVFLDGQDLIEDPRFERLGRLDDLPSYIREQPVDDVIIALPWSEDKRFKSFADRLRQFPVNVYLSADLIGYRTNFRQPPSHFGGFPIFEVLDNPFSGWKGLVKHAEDYILGVAAAIIFLPLMLIIALAIKIESNGPALFRQDPFRTFKSGLSHIQISHHARQARLRNNRPGYARRPKSDQGRASVETYQSRRTA